jgi:hypothetical protein
MSTTLADQGESEEAWLLARRQYVTASDICKLMTPEEMSQFGLWLEDWMWKDGASRVRDQDWVIGDLFDRKLHDTPIKFKDPVAVQWGRKEEDHNRLLFQEYAGVDTDGCHTLLGNTRWPYLACTLDGFLRLPEGWDGVPCPEMFDKPKQVTQALLRLRGVDTSLLEMKQTSDYGVSAWIKGKKTAPRSRVVIGSFSPQPPSIPVYTRPQVWTQMAIAGYEDNVAVVKGGASHMTAHHARLDDRWLGLLDSVNERVEEKILYIREALNE